MIGMIVACSENNVIGRDGDLPWHLPDDLKHFMRTTQGCPVIMGRKTFASLNGPLPRRTNIVVSRTLKDAGDGVVVVSTLEAAIACAQRVVDGADTPIWIAGGGEIYRAGLAMADQVVRTRVHASVEGDVFFPELDPQDWVLERAEPHSTDARHEYGYTIEWWERRGAAG